MLNFKTFLKEEADEEGEKLKHIEHLEDHPINDGAKGFNHAMGVLTQAHHHIISGKKDPTLAMKHDGSPSIVYGHHPETGKFFVASKSAFNKTPKINYTEKDVDANHGHAPGLAEKLKHVLQHLPKVVPKKGVYQGDLLFSGNDKSEEDGKVHFKPNTITYSAKKGSSEYDKVKKAKLGLYTHTQYLGNDAKSMHAHFEPDMSGFKQHADVYHREPGHDTGKVRMSDESHKELEKHMKAAQSIHDKHGDVMYDSVAPIKDHFKTYINHTVRSSEKPSIEGLQKHIEGGYTKAIDKLKTDKAKNAKKEELAGIVKHLKVHKTHLNNVFKLHSHLTQAKNTLVHTLSQHTGGLEHHVGGQSVKPEGFVVSHEGKVTKLNDRNEFNRLNFLKSKNR
jgi:Family of unknown function (DUF6267)